MERIGFVGLGHMGLPMALNLIKAGYSVTGFDLLPQAMVTVVEAGGFAAQTLQEVVQDKDVLITMLQTGEQVQQVCLGESGLYAVAKHILHLECSTIDLTSSRLLQEAGMRYRHRVLDAPVSGGVKGAQEKTLTFMVGGLHEVFETACPILAAMGQKIIHAGGPGTGLAAKICNNMVLGISMIAISEAFVLAESLGMTPQKLYEVMNKASGQCWALSHYAPCPDVLPDVPANHDYAPGFTAAMMLKDLMLAQNTSFTNGISTPMGDHAALIYQQLKDAGLSERDFSVIYQVIKEKSVARPPHVKTDAS